MRPTMSIIVCAYNAERHLAEALDSILNQSFRDFELIVVDDGSDDSTPEILSSYAGRHERIVIRRIEHAELAAARNAGLDAARADIIGFVDADDYIHPEYLEMLFEAMQAHGAQISACCTGWFEGTPEPMLCYFEEPIVISGRQACEDLLYDNAPFPIPAAWAKLYRKELFKELRYPEKLPFAEDQALIHRLLMRTETLAVCGKTAYQYRQWSGSIMGRGFFLGKYDLIEHLRDRVAFFESSPEATIRSIRLARRELDVATARYYWNALKAGCLGKALAAHPGDLPRLLAAIPAASARVAARKPADSKQEGLKLLSELSKRPIGMRA